MSSALTAAAWALYVAPAAAQTPVNTAVFTDIAEVRNAAEHYVARHTADGTQLDAGPLDPRARVPACTGPLQTSTAGRGGGAVWTVAVSCVAPQTWTLYVPVRVSNRQAVVVLTRNLRAGEPISADALTLEPRDTASLPFGYLSDPAQAIGKVLHRPFAKGSALTPDAIGNSPSIRRGQTVTLLGRSGSFEVRAEGRALADAGTGDLVSVENISSKRVVQGVVQRDGSVEVSL